MPKTPAPLHLADVAAALDTPHQLGGAHLAAHADNYAWLPAKSVDFVLTDPPFNIARDTNFHTYEGNTINSYRFDGDKGWDTYDHAGFIELMHAWAREFHRVLRPGGSFAIFCADAYVSHLIEALTAAGLSPRRTVSWCKPNAVPINRKYMMMSSCEYVVVGVSSPLTVVHDPAQHRVDPIARSAAHDDRREGVRHPEVQRQGDVRGQRRVLQPIIQRQRSQCVELFPAQTAPSVPHPRASGTVPTATTEGDRHVRLERSVRPGRLPRAW